MDFPGKNTGVSCYFLFQWIFPTQGSNPHLLHCRQILYHWVTREQKVSRSRESHFSFSVSDLFKHMGRQEVETTNWSETVSFATVIRKATLLRRWPSQGGRGSELPIRSLREQPSHKSLKGNTEHPPQAWDWDPLSALYKVSPDTCSRNSRSPAASNG